MIIHVALPFHTSGFSSLRLNGEQLLLPQSQTITGDCYSK